MVVTDKNLVIWTDPDVRFKAKSRAAFGDEQAAKHNPAPDLHCKVSFCSIFLENVYETGSADIGDA
jgi:hypothetical protein